LVMMSFTLNIEQLLFRSGSPSAARLEEVWACFARRATARGRKLQSARLSA
jgi:hypothetical protein